MTTRLPYAKVDPSVELRLMPTILAAKQFAERVDYERRKRHTPLDADNPIPVYKRSVLNYPIHKFPARRMKTIHQRLLEAKLTGARRPGFTYRGAMRNYRRAQAKLEKQRAKEGHADV